MIIANPIYDSVFKALMADLEIAKGVVSAVIGMRVVDLHLGQQEYFHNNLKTGGLAGLRLDFNAVVETEARGRFNVIIELQKVKIGANALRFRQYLATQYQAKSDVKDEEVEPRTLPIISIYLLGYEMNAELPMATHVARKYRDAVTGGSIEAGLQGAERFIELLTHDAYFIQIPKITGKMGSELERVLSVFDQQHIVDEDQHRLEVEPRMEHTDPLVIKMYRVLSQVQEDPVIQQAMKLEDLFIEEQKDVAAAEREIWKAKLEEETRKRQEETRKLQEEARKLEEETRKLQEETRKRQELEAELERLKK